MRIRLMSRIFVLAAVVAFSSAILAQTANESQTVETQAKTPIPDLSGVWNELPRPEGGYAYAFTKESPPMQPWAEDKVKANKYPGSTPDSRGRADMDPVLVYCFPPSPGWLLTVPSGPFEIIQTSGRVIMYFQWDHWIRQIPTDGRAHPKDPDPTWMGDSIGSWDGDTLVVDTVGFNDKTWLDGAGHVHSDALHMVERIRRVDHTTLEDNVTIDDPKTYTKSWSGQRLFKLRPDWVITEQVGCEDRLLHDAGAH